MNADLPVAPPSERKIVVNGPMSRIVLPPPNLPIATPTELSVNEILPSENNFSDKDELIMSNWSKTADNKHILVLPPPNLPIAPPTEYGEDTPRKFGFPVYPYILPPHNLPIAPPTEWGSMSEPSIGDNMINVDTRNAETNFQPFINTHIPQLLKP